MFIWITYFLKIHLPFKKMEYLDMWVAEYSEDSHLKGTNADECSEEVVKVNIGLGGTNGIIKEKQFFSFFSTKKEFKTAF